VPDRKSRYSLVFRAFLSAGGGTRTPDTRIMIPGASPVFTGELGAFGREVGLFCQSDVQFAERWFGEVQLNLDAYSAASPSSFSTSTQSFQRPSSLP
jgi:hypothetical protein